MSGVPSGASGAGSGPAQPGALAPRATAVSAAGLDVLQAEFTAYLLRNHADGRFGQEALFQKLEASGYATGKRYVERLTRDRERLVDTLDVLKFVCREFWTDAFRKAVDKLQTNNKGTFVLQDFNFRPLRHLSGGPGEDTKAVALTYLVGPCGMIRGALAGLGLECSVNADASALPRVVFQLRLKDAT